MRILSLDGGGGRGLVTLQVLKALESKLGGPVGGYVDMIAGTSTGGILAAALAAGVPAAKLEQLYLSGIPDIFHNGWKRRALTLWGLRDQKYSAKGLERLLKRVLGDGTLGDPTGDLAHPLDSGAPPAAAPKLLIPAWDLRAGRLKWHRSWREEDAGLLLRDVAHRTAAAPTYFEPYQGFCDGGVVANSPAYRAYLEAFKLEGNYGHTILSLGTGETREAVDPKAADSWGFGGWAKPLVGILVGGQGVEADDVLRTIYNNGASDRYSRIQPDMSAYVNEAKAMDSRDPKVLDIWVATGQRIAYAHDDDLRRFVTYWKENK